jgi:hypothetical protein
MWPWGNRDSVRTSSKSFLRHSFVIGPPGESNLFNRPARLYYCRRCNWRFLVCGNKVIVIDEGGAAVTGAESSNRFDTFQDGPCPALEGLESRKPINA